MGRDRRHLFPGRDRRLSPSFTAEEHAEVVAAARRAGLTPTGYCAVAALSAARGEGSAVPAESIEREALAVLQAELFDSRTVLNRIGTNLNQAVAAMHSTGTVPVWLDSAVALCSRSIVALDVVISAVHRRVVR